MFSPNSEDDFSVSFVTFPGLSLIHRMFSLGPFGTTRRLVSPFDQTGPPTELSGAVKPFDLNSHFELCQINPSVDRIERGCAYLEGIPLRSEHMSSSKRGKTTKRLEQYLVDVHAVSQSVVVLPTRKQLLCCGPLSCSFVSTAQPKKRVGVSACVSPSLPTSNERP